MNEYFSLRLKHLREKHGLSQAELADKIGVSRGSISFYENNSRVPDIDVLGSLCDFFSVSSDYLLGRSDQVVPSHSSASTLLGVDQNTLSPATREACAKFQATFHGLYDVASGTGFEGFFPTVSECVTDLVIILINIVSACEDYVTDYSDSVQTSLIWEFYNSLPEDEQKKIVAESETFKNALDYTKGKIERAKTSPIEKFNNTSNALATQANSRVKMLSMELFEMLHSSEINPET